MNEKANEDIGSELIIGLVSAVGTENRLVIELLEEQLGRAGYAVEIVKVSRDVIAQLYPMPDHHGDDYQRISNFMDAGNRARSISIEGNRDGDDSVLALGVAARIFARREKDDANSPQRIPRTAFIIDSLKRPEEVKALRTIYPSGFILIGVHEDENRRRRRLVRDLGIIEANAEALIIRDREEIKIPHGQRVNKTFHLADFFVRISGNHDQLRGDIQRMVELWFGNPFITPTFDEHAMFLAFAAALRSADLSRQVGAVVTRESQVLSTGANDCPKAGGGLYWPVRNPENGCVEDLPLGRDHTRKEGDSNRAEQNRIIDHMVEEARSSKSGIDESALRKLLSNSRIRDLTEYGRVVHAEMEALLCCSRNGLSTVGATLYSTTFPCHNCAKHIIAAGVSRVVYVEPYPKSRALDFHDDSIAMAPSTDQGKIIFDAFVGIGPRRFFDLFSMELGASYPLIRKDSDSGRAKEWNIKKAQLRIQMTPTSYLDSETDASNLFANIADFVDSGEADHEPR